MVQEGVEDKRIQSEQRSRHAGTHHFRVTASVLVRHRERLRSLRKVHGAQPAKRHLCLWPCTCWGNLTAKRSRLRPASSQRSEELAQWLF